MSSCVNNPNMWDTIESPQHPPAFEFQCYSFDIGLQSIGIDSEFERKECLTDFRMKKNNFTAVVDEAI